MIKTPIILLDPGHGIDTPGKRSPAKNGDPLYFREYSWAREISWRVTDELTKRGYTAFILVREEYDIPLKDRVSRVKAYCNRYGTKNVLLISIHNNAAGAGGKWLSARGWSAYTTRGVTSSDYLAAKFYDEAEKTFKYPLTVRKFSQEKTVGRDFESDFYIIKNTPCTAVLIEHFFQDNKDDVKYLKSEEGKKACVSVIVNGLLNYIKK